MSNEILKARGNPIAAQMAALQSVMNQYQTVNSIQPQLSAEISTMKWLYSVMNKGEDAMMDMHVPTRLTGDTGQNSAGGGATMGGPPSPPPSPPRRPPPPMAPPPPVAGAVPFPTPPPTPLPPTRISTPMISTTPTPGHVPIFFPDTNLGMENGKRPRTAPPLPPVKTKIPPPRTQPGSTVPSPTALREPLPNPPWNQMESDEDESEPMLNAAEKDGPSSDAVPASSAISSDTAQPVPEEATSAPSYDIERDYDPTLPDYDGMQPPDFQDYIDRQDELILEYGQLGFYQLLQSRKRPDLNELNAYINHYSDLPPYQNKNKNERKSRWGW